MYMLSKKDIVYPENFPGGLKGLVKSVLEEYMKQFGAVKLFHMVNNLRVLKITYVLFLLYLLLTQDLLVIKRMLLEII